MLPNLPQPEMTIMGLYVSWQMHMLHFSKHAILLIPSFLSHLQTIWQDWMLTLTILLLEGDDYGNSSDAAGTSCKHATLELRNRTVYRDATGSEPLTGPQLPVCIPDVDRACLTIKETISFGKHCVVRASSFCKHYKA